MDIHVVFAACEEDFIARMTSRLQKKKQIWDDSDLDYHLEGHILLSASLSLLISLSLSPSLSQSLSFFSSLSLTYLFSCNLSLLLLSLSLFLSRSLSFSPTSMRISWWLATNTKHHKHANILVACDKYETGYDNSAITLESSNYKQLTDLDNTESARVSLEGEDEPVKDKLSERFTAIALPRLERIPEAQPD